MLLSVFVHASCLAQTGRGPSEYRDFRDRRGRPIQARVLRASGDEVTVERKDGRQFTVPVSVFCQADRDYLRALASSRVPSASGGDWPRFRGPHGNGVSDEKLDLLPDGPKKLWQVTIAGGRGSVAVVSGKAYVVGNDDQGLAVSCLDAETGKGLWTTHFGNDGGKNATPTVVDGKVYVLAYRGRAFCLDARDGQLDWEQDLRMRGGKEAGWGHAGSPLIWEDLVICNVGAGVAVKKETGQIVWQHVGHSGHATPVLFTLKERTGVAIFSGTTLFARDLRSGKELWSIPWPTSRAVNACDPIFVGDKVLISTTYGKGGALFDLTGAEPKQVWFEEKLGSSYRTGVYWKGCVYGNAGRNPVCFDYATGRVHWQDRGNVGGFALLADEKLIYLTQKGLLLIANPTPDGLTPIVETQLLEGLTWGPPALCNGKLYVRNESGDLACWRIAAEK